MANDLNYVIDASISGMDFFDIIFEDLYQNLGESKFILTSATLRELDDLQKSTEASSKNARYIMKLAAIDDFHFKPILIEETLPLVDDCIIAYCMKENRINQNNSTVLLTCDKYMALKARMHNIVVQYYEHSLSQVEHANTGIISLVGATKENDKLAYRILCNDNKETCVVRKDGTQIQVGTVYLEIGDQIYIATKKDDCLTFGHYAVISLEDKENCQMVFSRRIYSRKDISNFEKAEYKVFVRSFIRRVGLN